MNRFKSFLPVYIPGLLLWAGLLLLQCAGEKPPVWGNANTGFLLAYRPNLGDVYYYQSSTDGVNTTEREGESMEFTNKRKYAFHLQLEGKDSLNRFILTIDSLSSEMDYSGGSRSMDYGEIQGKRLRVGISPDGRSKTISPIDSIPLPRFGGIRISGGGNRLAAFQIGFFPLPQRPLKVGDTWSESRKDTTKSSGRFNMTRIISRNLKYTVLGEEEKLGLRCLHLKIESEYERESFGKMGGSQISSEGSGETVAEVWFAYREGILVQYSRDDFFEGTTAYSGQMNATMPSSNQTKSVLRLLSWNRGGNKDEPGKK